MGKERYTYELLEPLARSSRTLAELMRKLELEPTGGHYRFIKAKLRMLGIEFSSDWGRVRAEIAKFARAEVEAAVRASRSVAAVAEKLNLPTYGGRVHTELVARINALRIDTSHFIGGAWARGQSKATHPGLASGSFKNTRPDAEVFVENSPEVNGKRLAKRLIALGRPYRCECCRLDEWCGKPLVLHLDHINGINNDNRLENLRFLCPNCHSQTDTYCGRNRSANTA